MSHKLPITQRSMEQLRLYQELTVADQDEMAGIVERMLVQTADGQTVKVRAPAYERLREESREQARAMIFAKPFDHMEHSFHPAAKSLSVLKEGVHMVVLPASGFTRYLAVPITPVLIQVNEMFPDVENGGYYAEKAGNKWQDLEKQDVVTTIKPDTRIMQKVTSNGAHHLKVIVKSGKVLLSAIARSADKDGTITDVALQARPYDSKELKRHGSCGQFNDHDEYMQRQDLYEDWVSSMRDCIVCDEIAATLYRQDTDDRRRRLINLFSVTRSAWDSATLVDATNDGRDPWTEYRAECAHTPDPLAPAAPLVVRFDHVLEPTSEAAEPPL